MHQLAALENVHQLTAQRDQRRQQQAEALCRQALELIERFGRQGDSAALYQALDLLQQSLAIRSTQAEPYALLGFIFCGLGNPQLTARYFQEAQRLGPELELVHKLRQLMSAGQTASAHTESAPLNSDALYDEVQGLLKTWQQQVTAALIPAQPLSAAGLSRFQAVLQSLTRQREGLQAQLELLAQDIDVLPFKLQLRPFELKLEAGQRQLRQAQLALELQARADGLRSEAEAALLDLKHFDSPCLEQLLDRCDALADDIDDLERQGGDISAPAQTYRVMSQAVMRLQDALDEQSIS